MQLHTTVSYQLTAEHIKRQSKIDYRSTDVEIVKRIHVPGNLNRKVNLLIFLFLRMLQFSQKRPPALRL